jgi:CP family cyanate transporter-like MFS transporter
MNSHQEIRKQMQEKESASQPAARVMLLVAGIIFIGMNLRAPLTSVGPLVGLIRNEFMISNTFAGMLTTIPLLAFAFVSPFAPKLVRKFEMNIVLFWALLLLFIGIVLRSVSFLGTLLLGTVLLGCAIAICNVLMPSLIKQQFPEKIGLFTGIYSVSMNLCGAIASGISIPFASNLGLGWKGALGFWAILTFISLIVWLPQTRYKQKLKLINQSDRRTENVNVWRSGLAWKVTLFMGLQSLMFYINIAWLPEILIERGLSSSFSGWILSLLQFSVLPFTFVVPIISTRMSNQRLLVMFTFLLLFVGYLGVMMGTNQLIPLWTIFIGIGGGCAFSLSMMFFSLRTQNSHQAAELSGMAQALGYLLASIGPTVFGMMHDITHHWTIPMMILIAAAVILLAVGLGAAKNEYVS